MGSVSDLILIERFDVEYGMIDLNDGEATRMGLQKNDCYGDGSRLSDDRVRELVKQFKEKSLVSDDKSINKLKVSGRQILYKQLQEAYAFGLACFSHIYHQQYLVNVLKEYDLHQQAANLIKKSRYNKWNAITALLYGEWENLQEIEDRILVYKRDRSAEKYAAVFAMLERKKVKVSEVVEFIAKYSVTVKSTGKKLKGIVALETAYRAAVAANAPKGNSPKSDKQIRIRNSIIARGESFDNDDVIETAKPKKLPDAVEFGRAVFKVVGDKMVIVGFDAWEQVRYEKHAYSRGKKMIDAENAVVEAEKSRNEAVNQTARDLRDNFVEKLFDGNAETVKILVDAGVNLDEMSEKFISSLKDMAAAKRNNVHFEQFADRVSD